MPTNLLDPVDFSCLLEGMQSGRVSLIMHTRTYQELLNRLGSLGGADGIVPQPKLNGIHIRYDEATPLHQVHVVFVPPHTRARVTLRLDL